jgi:tRNA modification GTPase
MYIRDTIAAISTPVGEGGIGIIRISGDGAEEIAGIIFRKKASGGLKSHRFYYGQIIDPDGAGSLDEGMLVLMKAPRSYTTEDVVELQCHGGYLLLQKVLQLVLRHGARLAEPGEFTKRAFLNGRIDLLQAEAVIDVIRGKTETALALARHQQEGMLSGLIGEVRNGIVQALALVEAYLDFPEEDIEPADGLEITGPVQKSLHEIERLLAGFEEGRVIREGVTVIIAGKPNAGKSSLMNTLLREKRAIVTSIPGTTRDIIEEVVSVKGLPVKILDTAGVRKTADPVEREGVRLALERVALADLVLLVIDRSRPFDDDDRMVAEAVADRPVVVIENKKDLPSACVLPDDLAVLPKVEVSSVTGEGFDLLREAVYRTFMSGGGAIDGREFTALSRVRHRDSLFRTREALSVFVRHFEEGLNLELLAVDLREALNAVGEITGETTPDDILDIIFQQFCIGK